jgi:transmembrane sensor
MLRQSQDRARIAEEAADWVFRIEEDSTPACKAEFVRWIQRSPEHMDEFLLARTTVAELSKLDAQHQIDINALLAAPGAEVVALSERAEPPFDGDDSVLRLAPSRRQGRLQVAALAACAVLAAGLWFALSHSRDTYATRVGEQRTVKLDDGSFVFLNTHSRVRVRFSDKEREVQLLEGEALFDVAHSPSRPFRVRTRTALIEAVGTQFNVYQRANGTAVTVLEGRVRVSPERSELARPQPAERTDAIGRGAQSTQDSSEPTPKLLAAGEEALVKADGQVMNQNSSTTAVAWRERKLIFNDAPLGEIVAEFNRYNRLELRIEDSALAGQRLTGTFAADRPQALLGFLATDRDMQVEWQSGDTVVIRVKPASLEQLPKR